MLRKASVPNAAVTVLEGRKKGRETKRKEGRKDVKE